MRVPPPPFFYIYGQSVREIVPNFLHVERVSDRWKLHRGVVQAHTHPHLHQLSLWTKTKGVYHLGAGSLPLTDQAPLLTWMPSGVVHGFEMSEESDAIVVSISHDFMNNLLEALPQTQIQSLRHRPLIQPLPHDVYQRLTATFEDIEREYAFTSWAQSDALAALMRIVFITLARLAEQVNEAAPATTPNTALYARFLAAIDLHYKEHQTVQDYASILATTPYLLNAASRQSAGVRASQVIRDRIVQEAKRLLLFTMLDAASVGFALGYQDPAHFGRFFKQATGHAPATWRTMNDMSQPSAGSPVFKSSSE